MFRKIVTELAFSPALAGSLGGYIKALREERAKRQIGLVFVVLAITVQLFATFLPPESANSNNPTTFVDGRIGSAEEYLVYYDQNTKNIRDLMVSLKIPRSAIEAAKPSVLPTDTKASVWSMRSNRDEASSAHFFKTANGNDVAAFYRDLDGSQPMPEVLVSSLSESGKWVAITRDGGNLITNQKDPSECSTWFFYTSDSTCPPTLESSLSARAIMSSQPSVVTANASDRIAYTISITNTGDSTRSIAPAIYLEDALEYARILDNSGGEYDYDTRLLSWPKTPLKPGDSTSRSFIIQLLPTIPSTAQGQYVTSSYDCLIQVSFGTTLSTPVNCPLTKSVERLTDGLPATPKAANLAFAFTLLGISTYFYLRSRQLLTELYIIRHNHSGGL